MAVGGRGTLIGPILGAVLVNLGKTWLTSSLPAILAICARCPVHSGDPVPAARPDGPVWLAPPGSNARPAGHACARYHKRGNGMSSTADTILYLDGVSVSFDGFRALNNLSLVLAAGEMRAVIGPNGAGKTTMMDVITGKTRPDAGRVVFGADTDLTRMDEPAIAALGIGRKFQKPTVFEPLTRMGQPAARPCRGPPARVHPSRARNPRRTTPRTGDTEHYPAQRRTQPAGRRSLARAEAMAGDRHAARPEAATSSGR